MGKKLLSLFVALALIPSSFGTAIPASAASKDWDISARQVVWETTTPPTVTTNSADNITVTSARLSGNLDSLGTAATANVSFQGGQAQGTTLARLPHC